MTDDLFRITSYNVCYTKLLRDVGMYMKELEMLAEAENLTFIHTDTAAYKGTHVNGFMKMTSAIAKLAEPSSAETGNTIQSRITSYNVCYTKLLRSTV